MTQIKANKIELVEVEKIVENPKNRNKHPESQIEALCKIIKSQGFREPLIVSARSGFLIAGHGRLMAAKKLEIKKVPVMLQEFESEAQEYQHMIADNEVARWASLDIQGLREDLQDFDIEDFNIEMLGIENFDLDGIESLEPEDLSNKNKEIDTDNFGNDLEHTCPKCGFEFNE